MKKGIGFVLCIVLLAGMFCLPAGAAEENYALGKPAQASSVYPSDKGEWVAEKAFDGNAGTRWASATGGTEYWIQVDLQQVRNINKMTFNQYESRVTKYSVEVSTDNLVWETVATGKNLGTEVGFNAVDAQFVRFNILEWTKEPTFYEIVITNGSVTPVVEKTQNLAKGGAADSGPVYGSYTADMMFDGKMDTRWASRKPEGLEEGQPDIRWFTVDLGAVKPINQMMLYEMSARIKEYKLLGSTDGETWTELKAGDLAAANKNSTVNFPAACVRYVKLEIHTYTDDPTVWETELYCTSEAGDYFQYYQFADAIDGSMLTDQPLSAVAGNLKYPLPETVTVGGLSADVTWQSSNTDVVNVQTGVVTRQQEDTDVTITARAAIQGMPDVPAVETSFDLTVKAAANDVMIVNALPQPVTVETQPWSVDIKEKSGFALKVPLAVELALSAQDAQNMAVSVGQTDAPFAQVQVSGDTYAIAYGSPMRLWRKEGNYPVQGAPVKFRFEINQAEGALTALVDDGAGWQTVLHNVKGMNTISALDQIQAAGEGGSLTLSAAQVRMNPALAVSVLEEQFDFTKLSDEKSMRVSKDLTLPGTLLEAAAQWQSSNPAAVDPRTGAVDPAQGGITALTVTVVFGDKTFTKTFRVMFGGGNLLAGMTAQTTGKSTGNGGIEHLLDEDIDTPYLTRSTKPYEITIDFPQETAVSHLTLFEAVESSGKITKFSIQAKRKDGKFEEIARGTEVGLEQTVPCALRNTTQLKISVEAFEKGSTGFSEITAIYAPSAGQVLEGDLAGIDIAQALQTLTLPAKGAFGSDLVWTSGNTKVLQLQKRETDYQIILTPGSQTQAVNLRVDAFYEEVSQSQGYQVEIKGTGGGAGPIGGSGGGGGGASSGGSGGIGMQIPIVNEGGVAPQPTPQPTPDPDRELAGHWAQKELEEMVDRGILKGDGSSLRLQDGVTRAEFASMLVRALQLGTADYRGTFSDVTADAWYAESVQAAADAGWMEGSGGLLRPEDPITREEMAKIVVKAYTYQGKTVPALGAETTFTDADNISGWAREGVAQAVELGLIQGFETGAFLPQDGLLREQAAVVIYRLITIL